MSSVIYLKRIVSGISVSTIKDLWGEISLIPFCPIITSGLVFKVVRRDDMFSLLYVGEYTGDEINNQIVLRKVIDGGLEEVFTFRSDGIVNYYHLSFDGISYFREGRDYSFEYKGEKDSKDTFSLIEYRQGFIKRDDEISKFVSEVFRNIKRGDC